VDALGVSGSTTRSRPGAGGLRGARGAAARDGSGVERRARSTTTDLMRAESRGTRRHEKSGTERGSLRRGARSG
jgi:hypothetical protein